MPTNNSKVPTCLSSKRVER